MAALAVKLAGNGLRALCDAVEYGRRNEGAVCDNAVCRNAAERISPLKTAVVTPEDISPTNAETPRRQEPASFFMDGREKTSLTEEFFEAK